MNSDYVRIGDVAEELSLNLKKNSFSEIEPRDKEMLRFQKENSNIGFEVGLEGDDQNNKSSTYFTFLHLSYSLGEDLKFASESVLPKDHLREIFHNYPVTRVSSNMNSDWRKDKRSDVTYLIGFKKEETNREILSYVLEESIDYICDYVTLNANTRNRAFQKREKL